MNTKMRIEIFNELKNHAWLGKQYKKLTKNDIKLATVFIKEKNHLSKNDFELAVNRMFLDNSNKPKNWKIISELLCCTNTTLN